MKNVFKRTTAFITSICTVLAFAVPTVYAVDETPEPSYTGGKEISFYENEELEILVQTTSELNRFIYENGYNDTSAYASLKWSKPSVTLYVRDDDVQKAAFGFIEENDMQSSPVDVIISPEYDFSSVCGGQKGTDEVNLIVADEYFALKKFMNESRCLGNIFLALKHDTAYDTDVTMVEIYVRTKEDAKMLRDHMTENYFWSDVVDITVTDDLTPNAENNIKSREFVVLEGDTNDDGKFNIADIMALKKYMLGTAEINERQKNASDISGDKAVNILDLAMLKDKIIK